MRLSPQNILSVLCLSLACFPALKISNASAQEASIGKHYAARIILVPRESEDFLQMSQPDVFDINGDGRDDVAYSGLGESYLDPAPLYIWTSNESGSMEISTRQLVVGEIPIVAQGYRQIIPADFNGDGRLDLFLEASGPEPACGPFCFPGGQNGLLLSDDIGKLNNVTTTHLPAYNDYTHGSSVGDFDGDGDNDIWVNNGSSHRAPASPGFPYLLQNDGQGSFTIVADGGSIPSPIVGRNGILPESGWGWSLWSVFVDADGDNDMDLFLGHAFGSDDPGTEIFPKNVLLINDGDGHFDVVPGDAWPLPAFFEGTQAQHSLVYDLNGDGLNDLLLHQSDVPFIPVQLQVLISNGDGTFRDETAARYPNEPVEDITAFQLHDLDGDGHKDLFSFVNAAKEDIRLNDGEGYFRQIDESFWVETDWNWVVLDVDGDGGTDLFENAWFGYSLSKMILPYGPDLDGKSGDDRLIGGSHNNVFRGLSGNDVLDGGLGNDDLDGGSGDDEIIGGKGDDWLTPGTGSNTVNGSPGRDLVEYAVAIDKVEIIPGETTFISTVDGSVKDEVKNSEYALFTDAATPLPIHAPSAITSLNGIAGLWFDPALDGEGFNVITTPSGTVIFFYGYTAGGQRLWLISDVLPDDFAFDQILDLAMYEGQGGTFDQPAAPDKLSEWGRLKGLFDACGTARFALYGNDGIKTTYQIKLAGIANADCSMLNLAPPSGLAGLWYDPSLDGEGYNIIITNSSTVFFFYGYDAAGQRLWLISDVLGGAPTVGDKVNLKMYVATGGTFAAPAPSSQSLSEWGEFEVTFNSCTAALAKLQGTDGEKTSNLTKLAGISGSACP